MEKKFKIKVFSLVTAIEFCILIALLSIITLPTEPLIPWYWGLIIVGALIGDYAYLMLHQYTITESGEFIFSRQKFTYGCSRQYVNTSDIVSIQWCERKNSCIFMLEYIKQGQSEYATIFPRKPELLIAALKEHNHEIKVIDL